jgi:hypothetical protein
MLTTLTVLSLDQGKLYGESPSTEALGGGFDADIAKPMGQAGVLARSWIGRLGHLLATATLGSARVHRSV